MDAPVAESYLHKAIRQLGQFLDEENGTYRLYHSTFSEFLTAPGTCVDYPECAIDPIESHRRVAAAYRGNVPSWGEVRWDDVDDYGLRHLAAHLPDAYMASRDLRVYAETLRQVAAGQLTVKDAIMKMPRLKRVGGTCPCSRSVRWVMEEPAAANGH